MHYYGDGSANVLDHPSFNLYVSLVAWMVKNVWNVWMLLWQYSGPQIMKEAQNSESMQNCIRRVRFFQTWTFCFHRNSCSASCACNPMMYVVNPPSCVACVFPSSLSDQRKRRFTTYKHQCGMLPALEHVDCVGAWSRHDIRSAISMFFSSTSNKQI